MPSLPAASVHSRESNELTLTESRHGHAHIVSVTGALDSRGSTRLTEMLEKLLAAHPPQITTVVLDLRGVCELDAAGARALAAAQGRCHGYLDLRIVAERRPVLAGLPTAGPGDPPLVYDTTEEALAPERSELDRLRAELAQRRDQLTNQPTIDQAKGMLMHNFGLSPNEAFALLRRLSQDTNVKVRVMAEELVGALTGRVSVQAARDVVTVIEDLRQRHSSATRTAG